MRSQPNYLRSFCFGVVFIIIVDVVFVVNVVLEIYFVVYSIICGSEAVLH